jgi:uncharacterized protein (TIGR03000 family)
MNRSVVLGTVLAALTLLFAAESAQAQRWYGGRGYYGYNRGWYGGPYYRGWYGGPYYSSWDGGPYYRNWAYGYYPGMTYSYATVPSYTQSNYPPYAPTTGIVPSSYESTAPNRGENTVLLHLFVPTPDTRLWIQDQQMQQTGTERLFYSPPLEPGKTYTYTIKATWRDGDREVNRTQEVTVKAGEEKTVRF